MALKSRLNAFVHIVANTLVPKPLVAINLGLGLFWALTILQCNVSEIKINFYVARVSDYC